MVLPSRREEATPWRRKTARLELAIRQYTVELNNGVRSLMDKLTTLEQLNEYTIRQLPTTIPVNKIGQRPVLNPFCHDGPPRRIVYGVSDACGNIE